MQSSEVLDLLCNGGKGLSDGKKEKSSKNAATPSARPRQDYYIIHCALALPKSPRSLRERRLFILLALASKLAPLAK